jgi:hypothetical protein
MKLFQSHAFSKNNFFEECKTFFSATLIAVLVFGGTYAYDAYAVSQTQQNTLTVTIAAATTFVVNTNSFGTLTPGTPLFATSTISVNTNTTTGWNVALYGNNQGSATASTTLYFGATPYSPGIADGNEWNATSSAATTTSVGMTSTTIVSGDDFLYFRVMTASGTAAFRAPNWWGPNDTAFGGGNAKWAGIASSTAGIGSKIGSISVNDQAASSTLNTVQYYLDVPANQQQGTYTGDLTYTWTSTP